jgi:hypothetical protein
VAAGARGCGGLEGEVVGESIERIGGMGEGGRRGLRSGWHTTGRSRSTGSRRAVVRGGNRSRKADNRSTGGGRSRPVGRLWTGCQ